MTPWSDGAKRSGIGRLIHKSKRLSETMKERLGQQTSTDAPVPADIAARLEGASVMRAELPAGILVVLAMLGGIYIGLGGALATLVLTDSTLGFGPGRLVAGVAFSLGLVLLVIGGGELFTGNNLMVLAAMQIPKPIIVRNLVAKFLFVMFPTYP
jgi:formate/nitrite transporter FocA (FNT family)